MLALNIDAADKEHLSELFFDEFPGLVDEKNRFVSIDGDQQVVEGCITSGARYGCANEQDRKAIEDA